MAEVPGFQMEVMPPQLIFTILTQITTLYTSPDTADLHSSMQFLFNI